MTVKCTFSEGKIAGERGEGQVSSNFIRGSPTSSPKPSVHLPSLNTLERSEESKKASERLSGY